MPKREIVISTAKERRRNRLFRNHLLIGLIRIVERFDFAALEVLNSRNRLSDTLIGFWSQSFRSIFGLALEPVRRFVFRQFAHTELNHYE